jgi:IS30 family transposase
LSDKKTKNAHPIVEKTIKEVHLMFDDIMDKRTKQYTHLTPIERGRIEELVKSGKGVRKIARILERSVSTISLEIKRGTVHQIIRDKDVYIYYADTAQRRYEKNRQNSVQRSFEEKYSVKFFEALAVAIKAKPRQHSIDTFVVEYEQLNPDESIPSTSVVYRLIDEQKLGKYGIKSYHLPQKFSRKAKKDGTKRIKGSNKKILGTSISERPERVDAREEFGHYEADLVMGKKDQGEDAVLTLVERKTRHAFVRRVSSREAQVVYNVLEGLVSEIGITNFKSITFDNGSEFSSMASLTGLDVYFAHAYSSFERGSNENFNGLLREYMPKGKSFNAYSDAEITIYQDCINNRLRKILGYKSAAEAYAEETVA